jgi:hypothetical protein
MIEEGLHTYSCAVDEKEYLKANWAYIGKSWRVVLVFACRIAFVTVASGVLFPLIFSLVMNAYGFSVGMGEGTGYDRERLIVWFPTAAIQSYMACCIGIAIFVGITIAVRAHGVAMKREVKRAKGEVMTFELTPETWSCTTRDGVKVTVPWPALKVLFENNDAWVVQYRERKAVVMKAPARAASLEEEFLRRTGRTI